MSMKGRMRTDSSGNVIIHLEGGLDYESILTFKEELQLLVKKNSNSLIVIDLYKLEFVGSSGIGVFISMMKEFRVQIGERLRISNVKSEFIKIFRLYAPDLADMLESEQSSHDVTSFPTQVLF